MKTHIQKISKPLFILMLGILMSTSVSYAQGQKNEQRQHKNCMQEELKLTDIQKEKIEKFRLQHMKEMTKISNLMHEKRAQLRTLKCADKIDQTKINAVIDEISKIENRKLKEKTAFDLKIRALLTDDQKIIFDSRHSKMHKQNKSRKDGNHQENHPQRNKTSKNCTQPKK